MIFDESVCVFCRIVKFLLLLQLCKCTFKNPRVYKMFKINVL